MRGIRTYPWMILPFGCFWPPWRWDRCFFTPGGKSTMAKRPRSGAITAGYYLLVLPAGGAHRRPGGPRLPGFIALVVRCLSSPRPPHPRRRRRDARANVVFLLAGALLANILGTVGASLLLVRPWLRLQGRRLGSHHVIFFIFIISNAGGCLTPLAIHRFFSAT